MEVKKQMRRKKNKRKKANGAEKDKTETLNEG